MSEVNKTIDRFFQSFINEGSSYNFFLLMADYVKALSEIPEVKPIIQQFENERLAEYEKLEKLEELSLKELDEATKIVLAEMENYKYLEGVFGQMHELKDYLDGKSPTSEPRPIAIERYLYNIIIENGSRYSNELVFFNKFKDPNRRPINTYGNYTFSKSVEIYEAQIEAIKNNNELWNAWYHLWLAGKVIRQGVKTANELIVDSTPRTQMELDEGLNYLLIYSDWKNLVRIKDENSFSNILHYTYVNPNEYKLFANRFHNHLIKELTKAPKIQAEATKSNLSFDSDESILNFQNKEITISKSKNSDPHYLLQTLFGDPKKVWNYDEVAVDWETEFDKTKWKRFYNAAHKVNQKVAIKTTIEDFLEASKTTVSINKKYLQN